MSTTRPTLQRVAQPIPFTSTPAVLASRRRSRYVDCSVCQADHSQYLFHRSGVRFVGCRSCGTVYVNPRTEHGTNFFDVAKLVASDDAQERALLTKDFEALLQRTESEYKARTQLALHRVVLLGRFLAEFKTLPVSQRVGLKVEEIDDKRFESLHLAGNLDWLKDAVGDAPQVVILHELLEACGDAGKFLEALAAVLPTSTSLVVTYTNSASLPARLMRKHWPPFFRYKTTFFNTAAVSALMARQGWLISNQFSLPVTHTLSYLAKQLDRGQSRLSPWLLPPLRQYPVSLRTGGRAACFRRQESATEPTEKLSIVFPCFNEASSVEHVLDVLLAKQLKIDKEIIVVESNSTDGTREIIRRYENHPQVRVIYEDKPRGKGHAVRTGLAAVSGTIVLIQDADLEYDIDDYDALLEPILQRRTSFVLGSRTLGMSDWKVRKFNSGRIRGLILNAAQLLFAQTYNLLYQQDVTDVNTMFKVFRRECLEGFTLEGNRFELDIELACKLAKNGYAPMEVPVNYVSRDFSQGKKISFLRDAFPSYFAFFKYRMAP